MERVSTRAWALILILPLIAFGISLKEAEKKAIESFPKLRVEKLEEKKKEEERLEKLGKFFPTVNLEASFNLAKKQSFTFQIPPAPPQEIVFQKGSYPKFTLQISQDLFNYTNFKEYELSKFAESIQVFKTAEEKNKLLYTVREAYINALKARSAVRIYKKHLEMVSSHLRDVKLLYEEGLVAFKDVLETKVKLYEVKEKLATAEANYRKALSYLSYLVGEEVGEVEEIEEDQAELPETDFDNLLELMKERRPILRYMRGITQLSKESIDLSKTSFYPRAVLELIYQRTEESDLFPKDRYFITFAFRWNLFSGLRRFRALELSRLSYRQTVENYRDLEEKLKVELSSVLEEIKAARAKLEFAKKQLEDAKEHLRIAEEKYRAGLGTNTEVLDAQSYLTTARETLAINRYELILKLYKLREVLGYE